MKKIKSVLKIILFLVILILAFNCIQGILVDKEKIIESKDYSYMPIYSSNFFEIKNFFNIITPKVAVIVYIIIQFVLFIIAIRQKNFKQWLKCNIITFTTIKIINFIFLNIITDESYQINNITDTMYIYEASNLVINIIILVVSVMFNIMLVTKYRKKGVSQELKDRISIIMYTFIIIFFLLIICSNLGTRMYVFEREWGFDRTFSTRYYSRKIDDIKDNFNFTILDIDKDGVLIEYTRGYYVPKGGNSMVGLMFDGEYKTEIVQQKLIWNVWYRYSPAKDPMLAVDGGIDYYIKLKK